ncbi:MAG: ATP-binding cassette domain-containing protein, partial [Oscillospiraceae bacterium]|nr:ATP-binding cassette domain-containing protein [Oscillospiraceae bacterium]
MIKLSHVTKSFERNGRKFNAADDVNLHICRGEFAALIGHSGSGKTTLLNIISGLSAPDSGKVFIAGTDIAALSGREAVRFRGEHIGYVLQGQSLLSEFSVFDNVCMPAY